MISPLRFCALCVALLGCGSDEIEHDGRQDDRTTGFFAGGDMESSPTTGNDGNFPEPALTRCGELGQLAAIDGLRSAWGVVAVDGAWNDVEAGTIRLRLSENVISDCQDELSADGWRFALTLAPQEASPGVGTLDELSSPDLEMVQEGESESLPVTGTLRRVRVTQDCVVGELVGMTIDGEPAPELDGGFAAELCARTCLPTASTDC